MPLPIISAIGAGLASQAGTALLGEAGKAIASAVDPAAIAYRQQLKRDISALNKGQLGLSEAEKRTMLAGAQRSLQAQTASTEANLRRAAAAQGGFGRSGAQQAALGALAANRGEQLTSYAGKVDELSQAQAQRRFADVMNRIQAKRDEARQTGATLAGAALGVTALSKAAYPQYKADWLDKKLKEAEAQAAQAAAKTENPAELKK
jgi:hypothetical protein